MSKSCWDVFYYCICHPCVFSHGYNIKRYKKIHSPLLAGYVATKKSQTSSISFCSHCLCIYRVLFFHLWSLESVISLFYTKVTFLETECPHQVNAYTWRAAKGFCLSTSSEKFHMDGSYGYYVGHSNNRSTTSCTSYESYNMCSNDLCFPRPHICITAYINWWCLYMYTSKYVYNLMYI